MQAPSPRWLALGRAEAAARGGDKAGASGVRHAAKRLDQALPVKKGGDDRVGGGGGGCGWLAGGECAVVVVVVVMVVAAARR